MIGFRASRVQEFWVQGFSGLLFQCLGLLRCDCLGLLGFRVCRGWFFLGVSFGLVLFRVQELYSFEPGFWGSGVLGFGFLSLGFRVVMVWRFSFFLFNFVF